MIIKISKIFTNTFLKGYPLQSINTKAGCARNPEGPATQSQKSARSQKSEIGNLKVSSGSSLPAHSGTAIYHEEGSSWSALHTLPCPA